MSTVTHFNPDSIYGFDSASTGSVLTKGSSSSITFQNISAIVPSNISYFTNDANYINSAVTSMTNYATSADVVNSLNIVNNELPMSVYLFVNSSDGTAGSYRDINGSEPISVREIVEYLNSGRTVEFYSRPIPWAGGRTPYTRLDNVMFGIGYIMPSSDRTYRIYGEAFNYGNNKQYNFEAIDSTQDANPNYTWSATTTTNKSDYATSANVVTALDNKVDKVSGMGLSTNDYTTAEKNKLASIASGAEVNVQSDWNQIDSTADDFIKNKPTIPDTVSGVNDGTNWTSITIGGVTKNIPSGGGGGGLTNYDFIELTPPTITNATTTITFAANQRNTVEFSTNADLSIALVSNNKADNYIWITNSHSTDDIDVTFSSMSFGNTTINDIRGTDNFPTIKAGETIEIGVHVTDTKARITSKIL